MKKPISFGWAVLIGPLMIVIGLSFVEGLPWVADQSEKGAQAEALTNNSLGQIAMKNGHYKEAYQQFMTALHIKEDYTEAYVNLGILFHLMAKDAKARNRPAEAANMDAEAIKHLKKAISLNPKKKNMIYNNLGMIYAYEAKYDTALTMFRTALDLGIRPAPIWRNIGQIEGECQNWNKAIESYRNAIKNKRTLKNMYTDMLNGALYAVENDDYIEKVQEILEHGVSNEDLAPFDSVIFNIFLRRDVKLAEDYKDLAIAYEKNGQINEAIHHFRKALEVRPKWSAIYNRIGIIFARHDMLGEAKTAFRDALRVDPENNGAKSNLEHVLKRMKDEG